MSLKERIKNWFTRYRQWQRDPFMHLASPSEEKHHCHCCENDYSGNFCPRCGQKSKENRITWSSIRSGVMDLWGMGTRSLPNTLWQLIWRPGYLIGDYIRGRHQVSFPPIKMLAFLALFVFILSNWVNPESTVDTIDKNYFLVERLEILFAKHYDWATMLFFTLFIIPTYFIFRYAPRCRRHTIPEGFFIQVFMSTKCLIYILLINIADALFDVKSSLEYIINILTFLLLLIMLQRTYRQLFGYGFWSTLWRVVAVVIGAIFTLFMLLSLDASIALVLRRNEGWLLQFLLRFLPFLMATVSFIFGTFLISRYNDLRK